MSQALTVRELLGGNVASFNPLDIDTSEIQELSNSLPRDGQIDLNQAEILATRFLRGADVCGELMAVATCYVSKLETAKKKAYSEAALSKTTAAGIKTDKSRCLFADADPDYIEACNRYSEAVAFMKWSDSKYNSFVRAHYNAKKLLDRQMNHEQASGFNCSTDKVIEQEQCHNSWGKDEPDGMAQVNDDTPGEEQDDFDSEW